MKKEFIKIPLRGKGFIQIIVVRNKKVCDFSIREERLKDYENDILLCRLLNESINKLNARTEN